MCIKPMKLGLSLIITITIADSLAMTGFSPEFSQADVENVRGRGKELFEMYRKVPPPTGADAGDLVFVYYHKTNGVFGATNTTLRIEKRHPNGNVKEWTYGLIGVYLYFADGHDERFDYRRDGGLIMHSSNIPQLFNFKTYAFDMATGGIKSYLAITNGVPVYPSLTFEDGKVVTNKPKWFCVRPKENAKNEEPRPIVHPDSCRGVPVPTEEQSKRFWRLYGEFRQQYKSSKPKTDIIWFALFDGYPAYCELEKSGTEILPLMYQARISRYCSPEYNDAKRLAQMADDIMLEKLWTTITFQHTVKRGKGDFIWAGENLITWWEGGDKFAAARAEFLLYEMREARQEGRPTDERRALVQLTDMGMFAFPTLFPELEAGREDVLAVFKMLSECSKFKVDNSREALLAWWKENRKRYALPTQAPNFKGTLAFEKWQRLERPKPRQ